MGKVLSLVSRKVNRFNVENRAHRYLDKTKDKPSTAPKYESTLRDIERSLKEDPDFLIKQSQKDKNLNERLKQVYVTSEDVNIDYSTRNTNPDRPLPLDRSTVGDFEFGYKEPNKVSIGRCTLRQAVQFMSDHQNDPNLWTIEKISNDYKLKMNNVENILNYFKMLEIYIPDKRRRENILTQAKSKLLKDPKEETST